MAYDATRPIPWARLLKDWAIYAGIMSLIFLFLFRDDLSAGTFIGLAASLPIYLFIGALLAKFGIVRRSMRDVRAEATAKRAASASASTSSSADAAAQRARPAPTKRTSTGPSQHRPAAKRKR